MGVCQSDDKKNTKKGNSTGKKNSDSFLRIRASTWTRDSHGLFDYESSAVNTQTIKLRGIEHVLARENNEIVIANNTTIEGETKPLLRFTYSNGTYQFETIPPPRDTVATKANAVQDLNVDTDESAWMTIRNLKIGDAKGYVLKQGDYLKLGRVKYRVKELRTENPNQLFETEGSNVFSPLKERVKPKASAQEEVHEENNENNETHVRSCRICLQEGQEFDNPLVCPCECAGTMKYVHSQCLAHWLESRTQFKKQGAITTVVWKSLDCELCKTPLPESVDAEGKRYDLIDLQRPSSGPYAILEVVTKDRNIPHRGIHILDMKEKKMVKIGRGHDSDLRIHDISVSRYHAVMKYENGKFIIDDNNSKFGTLILLPNQFPLKEEMNGTTIQVGRSSFTLFVERERKWNFMTSCFQTSTVSIEKDNRAPKTAVPGKLQEAANLDSPLGREQNVAVFQLGPLIIHNVGFQPEGQIEQIGDTGNPNQIPAILNQIQLAFNQAEPIEPIPADINPVSN